MLHVRSAVPADMATILAFIDEAAGWLSEKGTDQWSKPWPDEEQRDGRVRRGIEDGCTWMVHDNSLTIGTISCRPAGNPNLWSPDENNELAVYVSRLIVCRDYAGQGIGNELFDWAGKWATAQYGARWIRIDVWTTNGMLHDYYQKRGFDFVRKCDYVDYPSAMLFQKRTSDITDADVPRLREVPELKRPSNWMPPSEPLVPPQRRRRIRQQLAGVANTRRAVGIAARMARIALIHGSRDAHRD